MCGFLGAIGATHDPAAFQRALDLIAHRGPDGEGVFTLEGPVGKVALGHRRLAIIDLSPGGAQPMHSADGRFTMVFNGEIFNYRELRTELEAEGVAFRSHSDTEVLLELYVRRGPAIFAALNGMFALAVYEHATGDVVVARDHLGIKPLYYHHGPRGFLFGSEVKSLLALGLPARLRRDLLGEYLAQMWIMEPDTMFQDIYKLPAGHWGRFRGGRLATESFWDVRPGAVDPTDALERLQWLVVDAVRMQLIADRPVGAYISGGVDSSVIAHLAAADVADLIAVSCRFRQDDQRFEGIPDDGIWADRFAAAHPSMRYHTLELSPDLFEVYKQMVWHMDEPIADPAAVPAYLLAKQARDAGAIVMLSGMGGDELFGGYKRYAAVQLLDRTDMVPPVARHAMLAVANAVQTFVGGPVKRRVSHAQRFLQGALDGWPLAYINMVGHHNPVEIDALVGREWRTGYERKVRAVLTGFEDSSRLLQAQRIDLKGFLASHNLIYSDKASMAASVEVRVPLLDYRLAEFAFGLPDALRASGGEEKVLLKRLCASLVDPDIAYRRKSGFAMPIRSWLQGPLRPIVERALNEGRVAGLVDRATSRKLIDAHYSGRQENSWKLWMLLNLDIWLERFEVAA